MMNFAASVVVLGLLLLSPPASAQPELVRARLLADTRHVQPGQAFRLGLLLEIEPGWHIYWRNPGQGGVPTELELKLPEGFSAEPLKYPLPQRFVQPGQIIGYGYKDRVMLLVEVQPPTELPAQGTLPFAVEASWLACDPQVCIPGSRDLTVQLPVAEAPRPANSELFEEWAARIPKSAGEVTGQVRPSDDGRSAVATARLPITDAMHNPELFIDAPPTLLVDQAELSPRGGLQMRLRPEPKNAVLLPLLITYTDRQDQRQGLEIQLHLPVSNLE